MTNATSRILTGIAVFLVVCILGTLGYVAVGWPAMDAVYMVMITIFGVGYGEVRPVATPGLRGFTIAVIVGGYAAALYAVGGFVQLMTEGEINRALGARRMSTEIRRLSGHVIVCGFGRVGRILARELAQTQKPLVVIDDDPAKVVEAEALGYLALRGNASLESTLEEAGVKRAAFLCSVLSDDAANVFTTLTVREMAPDVTIVARAEDPATESKLVRSGATSVVLPASIGAKRIAHLVTRPGTEEILGQSDHHAELDEQIRLLGLRLEDLKIRDDSPLVGRTVADIEVHGNRGFLIVALRRADGRILTNPAADTPLAAADTVVIVGQEEDLPVLRARYDLLREVKYRGASVRV